MDYITIILIITLTINLILGFLVILSAPREIVNRLYLINVVTICLWVLSMIVYRLPGNADVLFLARILYCSATIIASSFLYFTYFFPRDEHKLTFTKKILLIVPTAVLVFFTLYGNNIISSVAVLNKGEHVITFGKYYFAFAIYILLYFNIAFYRLFKKFTATKDNLESRQIMYLFIGYSSSGTVSFATNLILPWIGYFELNWVGQVSTVLMVSFAAYAIFKHHLFSIKVIAAELITFLLWAFILIRVLLSESFREQMLNTGLLFFAIIFGVIIIRGVIKEIQAREKIEKLAHDLEKANNHLTEMDKQKSEFVSFATHQLRAPITAMKGYSSMILEGDLGTLSNDAKEAVSRIFQSSKTLATVVDDYLNASRIELGTMKYDLTRLDLTEMIHDVIDEIKPNITKSGLNFSTVINPSIHFFVSADRDKLKQVITNIIDNSIKYTPKGSLTIGLDRNGDKVRFSVKDTGIGISAETMPKLFSKFARAHNANKANIHGTGLGLFVAKDIVTAHKGKIWAESQGDGKGTQFYVELDLIK